VSKTKQASRDNAQNSHLLTYWVTLAAIANRFDLIIIIIIIMLYYNYCGQTATIREYNRTCRPWHKLTKHRIGLQGLSRALGYCIRALHEFTNNAGTSLTLTETTNERIIHRRAAQPIRDAGAGLGTFFLLSGTLISVSSCQSSRIYEA